MLEEEVFRIVVGAGVILACLAFVVQAFVVVKLYRLVKAAQQKVLPLAERASPIIDKIGPAVDQVGPMLTCARQILEENRPHIHEIASQAVVAAKDAAATVKSARQQAEQIGEVVQDATERAKVRIEQIDRSVVEAVIRVEQAGGAVRRAVSRPVREVNGLWSGIAAAVSAYVHGRKYSVDHATQDEEMFI